MEKIISWWSGGITSAVACKSEFNALAEAAEKLKEDYHLDVIGHSHDPDTIDWDLSAVEFED
jgi:hypothetical protein